MHAILTDHPGWQALDRREERLDRADAAYRDRSQKAGESYRAQRDRWKQQHDRAVLDGSPPPPEPKRPASTRREYAVLLAERDAIRRDRQRFLRDHADELEARLREREAAILDDASDLADRLAEHADEAQALISVARRVRGQPVRAGSLDAAGLVRVVEAGESLLAGSEPTATRDATIMARPEAAAADADDGLVEVGG